MNDPTSAPQILFVDDEATAVKYFQRALGALAEVATAGSVEEGKRVLDAHAGTIVVLVSDQRMPGAYGNELLQYARERYPHIVRILTTAYSELDHTVEAVNQGQIHRYLQKPWEIAALRMELRQALELGRLQKEHAALLREKLQVRQHQTHAHRIASLHALCAGLARPGDFLPIEAYLSAALGGGEIAPEPDWLLLDYAEAIALESFRSAEFGAAVRDELARLEREAPQTDVEQACAMLARGFGTVPSGAPTGAVVVLEEQHLTQFLTASAKVPVSALHASWLAHLLWLGRRGWTLQCEQDVRGVECRLVAAGAPLTPEQLAAWVEQF